MHSFKPDIYDRIFQNSRLVLLDHEQTHLLFLEKKIEYIIKCTYKK